MEIMKKPTLKQLKKRPAIWQFDGIYSEIGCIFPDGKMYFYSPRHKDWTESFYTADEWLKEDKMLFLGWL